MSKWYIIFVVAIYATFEIIETVFGESDIYTIILASSLGLAVFLGVLLRKKANLANAALLIAPILLIVVLLSLRYFLKVQIADWVIWTAGLISGVICLGFFQTRVERRF